MKKEKKGCKNRLEWGIGHNLQWNNIFIKTSRCLDAQGNRCDTWPFVRNQTSRPCSHVTQGIRECCSAARKKQKMTSFALSNVSTCSIYRSRNLANQLEVVNLEQKVLIPYNTGFHWMLHVIDLRENCVYVLDSLRSKVNEDIHGIINKVEDMTSETRSITLSINSKMETCKVPSSIGFCRVWVLRAKFNTKNAYRQEEIDEIRTEWATFVSRFVRVERCADILGVEMIALDDVYLL
uniref:Ubiquitin-like protease family profile domain-containing protein n=1 Tax=Cucumis melo TaxID=3656 RepID=A0A9I9EHN9_CUCME